MIATATQDCWQELTFFCLSGSLSLLSRPLSLCLSPPGHQMAAAISALNLLSQKERGGSSKRTRWVKADPVPFYFLIGGHNIMLVSTTHQHESAIGIRMSPSFLKLRPTTHPIPLL